MKRFLFLMIVTVAIIFTGCSKDDDGSGSGELVGKWEAVAEHELQSGQWQLEYEYESGETVWEFTSGGKLSVYEEGVKEYTVTYSYDASKKQLTMMGIVCEVEKLTSTELVIIAKSIDVDPTTYKTTYRKK